MGRRYSWNKSEDLPCENNNKFQSSRKGLNYEQEKYNINHLIHIIVL